MTIITTIKEITPELSLKQYNEIPVLVLNHPIGNALISLQGAQLFSWRPKNCEKDLLWLSEVDPFAMGNAIRGGIPICYPWFGGVQSPAHGYARISLWQLSDYELNAEKVQLEFCLFSEKNLIEAKITMTFTQECEITFKHYGKEPAQLALHSYFNLSQIENITLPNLPTQCFNAITQQQEIVPSPRTIDQHTDCIYSIPSSTTSHKIVDKGYNRTIELTHHNASNVVLWNPWHKEMSGMTKDSYKTMVCLETARIHQPLSQGESVGLRISSNKF